MPAPKINYEGLKSYIPQNGNEENYALLTHYLMMRNGDAKNAKRAELLQDFAFEEAKLNSAEDFYGTKGIPFVAPENLSFTFIDLFSGIGKFQLDVPLTSFGSGFSGFRCRFIRGQAANGYAAPTIPNVEVSL